MPLPGVIQVRSNLIPWRGSEAGREGYFSRSAQSLVKSAIARLRQPF